MKKMLKPQRTQSAPRMTVCRTNWQFVLLCVIQSAFAPPRPIPVRAAVRAMPAVSALQKTHK
jgi:hypothetical protein